MVTLLKLLNRHRTHLIRLHLAKRGFNVYRMGASEQRTVIEELSRTTPKKPERWVLPDKLADLRARYAGLSDVAAIQHSAWKTRAESSGRVAMGLGEVDLANFRGNSAYVDAYATPNVAANRLRYFIYANYVRHRDSDQLLSMLSEDAAFGCLTYQFDSMPLTSRDLLDSILEIGFLNREFGVLQDGALKFLDVGAGYGRLAHRLAQANAGLKAYHCVDAIPESTYICDYYLHHRQVPDSYSALPLDDFAAGSGCNTYDVAINIHSFSECTRSAVSWWLEQLVKREVKHLLIVPNEDEQLLTTEVDGSRGEYASLMKRYGFELASSKPLIEDKPTSDALGLTDMLLLFQRR